MDKFFQQRKVAMIAIILIMASAFMVRFYHFHDWLYFKMDQSRDAFMIANAVQNGPQDLPLLGARAGATKVTYGFLHLGPIFYYFQYLSGVIFHSTIPDVFAYPDLFFGIMILPLLYIFSRIYFKRYISLLIILMYAFSFLIIEYSRFAWNPNSLPFFTILSFLALLKFLNTDSEKKRALWIVLWATGMAIGSQLHFVGFFCLMGISGLLIIYHYQLWSKEQIKKIFKKEVFQKIIISMGIALMVFIFFYTPVIISDTIKHGENTKDFIEALSSKPAKKPLLEKIEKDINEQVRNYTLITTSYIYPKKTDASKVIAILFTLSIFLGGIYLSFKNIIKGELKQEKKDFLTLILLWIGVFFILCIPLAYQIRPRFFIFTFGAPFILLGIIFEFLREKKVKLYQYLIILLTAIVLFSNAYGTMSWFQEQAQSQKTHFKVKRTLILKVKDGVTLGQLEKVANYIYNHHKPGYTVYFYSKPEHIRPLEYLFWEKNDPNFTYTTLKLDQNPKAQYFAVVPAKKDAVNKITKKYGNNFTVLHSQKFGQLEVFEINFTNRKVSKNFIFKKKNRESSRVFWKDVFGIKETFKPDVKIDSAK